MWPLDIPNASFGYVAEKNKMLVTYPYPAKYKGNLLWSYGPFSEYEFIQNKFKEIYKSKVASRSKQHLAPPPQPFSSIEKMHSRHSFWGAIRASLRIIKTHLSFIYFEGKDGVFKSSRITSIPKKIFLEFHSFVLFNF